MAIFKNDTNTRIEFDVGIDTSEIEEAKVTILYPSGDKRIYDLQKQEDSKIVYLITDSDTLKEAGIYELQVKLFTNDEWKGSGNIVKLEVLNTL